MTLQVEGTNDSSCLSKYSAAQRGYFDDEFLTNFVTKCPRRAPLIHLGYSVRAVIINTLCQEFLDTSISEKQVVSFGAGFDTTFFKLRKNKPGAKVVYYELDLPRVVERKVKCILHSSSLCNRIGTYAESEDGLVSESYKLLAIDLRDISRVEDLLRKHGLNLSVPTLFLSECAITYLEEQHSSELIKLASRFEHSTLVVYEQIHPDDGFGLFMTRHFTSLNSPLLSVASYPTLQHQTQRYISRGWERCRSVSALNAYEQLASTAERSRLLRLEPFDEWEEFYLKCNHYCVVIASQGSLANWSKLTTHPEPTPSLAVQRTLEWELVDSRCKPRYGHSAVMLGDRLLLVGGYGIREDNTHGRLRNIVCLRHEGLQWLVDAELKTDQFFCMFSTWTSLSDQVYLVYGGRTSPGTCVHQQPELVTVREDTNGTLTVTSELLLTNCHRPARWRHSAVLGKRNNIDTLVVFGGRTSDLEYLDDTWIIPLTPADRECVVVPATCQQPCPRFSHSAAVSHKNSGSDQMWVSGGLGSCGVLGDVWCLDLGSLLWSRLLVPGLLARFGHSSSVLHNSLLLVGGVGVVDDVQPGVAVVDLLTGLCVEYQLPVMSPDKSALLINHRHIVSADKQTLWVVGGGGNCFSFGTFFNKYYPVIKLNQFNL